MNYFKRGFFGGEEEKNNKTKEKNSRMCDTVAARLTTQDVFGVTTSRFTLTTALSTGCTALSAVNRFTQYCLVPTDLAFGSVCDTNGAVSDQPTFIFQEMTSGELKTLDELPVLWSSAPVAVGNNNDYISIPSASDTPLVGPNVAGMAIVGSSEYKVIMAIERTTGQGYVSEKDGLYHIITAGTIPHCQVALSSDANLRVVSTRTDYFIWTNDEQKWVQGADIISGQIEILQVKAWLDASDDMLLAILARGASVTKLTIYKNTFTGTPFHSVDIFSSFASSSAAMALTDNGNNLFCILASYTTNSTDLFAKTINLTTLVAPVALGTLTIAGVFPIASNTFGSTFVYGDVTDTNLLVVFSSQNARLFDLQYPNSGATPTLLTNYSNSLNWQVSTSDDNGHQAFTSDSGAGASLHMRIGGTDFTNTPSGSLNQTFVGSYSVEPDGIYQLLDYTGKIRSATAATTGSGMFGDSSASTLWMYVNCIDTGKAGLDVSQYNPGPLWFMGTLQVTDPLIVSGITTSVKFDSLHNRYRYVATAHTGGPNGMLATKIIWPVAPGGGVDLYRTNEVKFINTSGYQTRLFDDGNIRVVDSSNVMIWENFMHDGFNSTTNYVVVSLTTTTTSKNGFYITYWPSNGTFVECYYPYNAKSFRDYGITNDTVFANSILAQTDFCWDNLQDDPTNNFNVGFTDDRCTCIGQDRLFPRVFTNTELLDAATRALLLQNLPCMMIDCTATRILPEPTNTFRLLEDKCKVNLVICTNILRAENSASIGNVSINQTCGGQIPNSCGVDADCAVGSVCRGGMCLVSCALASDCKSIPGSTVYDCVNSVCVAASDAAPSGLSIGAIAGIAVAAVVVVVLISVLTWYFVTKAKTAGSSSSSSQPPKPQPPKPQPPTTKK